MAEGKLDGIRACVFDAYGTLFDVASAAARCSGVPPAKLGPLNVLWRQKQLEYTWLRTLQGLHADFWQVTGDALDFAVENARLTPLLDAVLSVEEVGAYKTHPKVYQLALERLGLARQAIAFQSSNAWDAHAASAFGMRVVWCNRYRQRRERLPGRPDREIASLDALPPLVGA